MTEDDRKQYFKKIRSVMHRLVSSANAVLASTQVPKRFAASTSGGELQVFYQTGNHLKNPILTVTYSPSEDIIYFRGDDPQANVGCYYDPSGIESCLERCRDAMAKEVFSDLVLTTLP